MDVFADVVLFVEVLFLFLEDFEESLSFGLRWRIKIEVIEDELTFEIDVVNDFQKSYSPFILIFFNPTPNYSIILVNGF